MKLLQHSFKLTFLVVFLFILSLTSCDNINDNSKKEYDWLIMYYVDGDNDIEQYLIQDLNEMESVNFANKKIKIIALVDRISGYWTGDGDWTDTRAYEIGYDGSGFNNTLSSNTKRIAIPSLGLTINNSVELNMGDPGTLKNFITFCKDNYRAKKNMLLFTNHGGGWRKDSESENFHINKIKKQKAVCWDNTNSFDTLYMKEVREAIESSMRNKKFDIIAFDACNMGMIEVADELKNV
jgi:clostripain